MPLTLISYPLCPYVQRAAISLSEKNIPFKRVEIDLAEKPDWFLKLSPTGEVPVLSVRNGDRSEPIFESSAILEFLEDTTNTPLHPSDPLERSKHRAWIEFGSGILNGIAGFYSAPDEETLQHKAGELQNKFKRLEQETAPSPWFGGKEFSLVDAVFAPVFRYFDTFDAIADFGILTGLPKISAWRNRLSERPSVRGAVGEDYPDLLEKFLIRRNSALSRIILSGPSFASRATR